MLALNQSKRDSGQKFPYFPEDHPDFLLDVLVLNVNYEIRAEYPTQTLCMSTILNQVPVLTEFPLSLCSTIHLLHIYCCTLSQCVLIDAQ